MERCIQSIWCSWLACPVKHGNDRNNHDDDNDADSGDDDDDDESIQLI